nr:hypothetical protein Iba_chr12cCG16710 [Ipomoea batatas]
MEEPDMELLRFARTDAARRLATGLATQTKSSWRMKRLMVKAVVDRAPSPNSDSPPTLRLCSRAHRRHHSSSRYRRLHSSSARRLRSGELTAVAADPSPNAAESSLPSPSQFRRRTRELVATAAESTCCRSRVLRVAVLPVASPSPSQQSTPVTITIAAAESSGFRTQRAPGSAL